MNLSDDTSTMVPTVHAFLLRGRRSDLSQLNWRNTASLSPIKERKVRARDWAVDKNYCPNLDSNSVSFDSN